MSEILIQFSRAAPVLFFDKWIKDRALCICRLTHSPFSHVDLVMDDPRWPHGSLLGSSNNPTAPVIIGNPCGVALRHCDYQEFAVRRVARIPCTPEQKQAFTQFCLDQLGKPFDSEAIRVRHFLSFDFKDRDWRDDRNWFCAEMMARATEHAKLLSWKLACYKNRVTATDYLLIINPLIDVDEFYAPIMGMRLGRYEQENIV